MSRLEYMPQISRPAASETESDSEPTLSDLVSKCNDIMDNLFFYGLVLCGSQLFTVWLVAQILAKVG